MYKNIIYAVILAILFTWFALSNSQVVAVTFLFKTYQFSLSLVILVSILIGIIIAGLTAVVEETKLLNKLKEVENKLKHDEDIIATKKEKK